MTLLHQAAQKAVEAALRRAFDLGQLYWQQADSESYKQNAKADATQAKFDSLAAETIAALQHQEVPREPVAWLNPSSGKTCSADEKFSMENHQGMPGKAVAAHFSDPLYASPSTTRQQEVGSDTLAVVRKALAELAEGYNEANCAMCKGRGFYGIPGGRCTFCDGKGRVRWRSNPAPSTPEKAGGVSDGVGGNDGR